MRKSTLLAALLLLAPVVSQAKTLEDLLIEKGVITKGEAQGTAATGPAKVYWNQGTRIDFPDNGFTTGINTLIQTRYTFTDTDNTVGGGNVSGFDVTHAAVIVSGTALHQEFEYKLDGDFVTGTQADGSSGAALRDAYLKWNACDFTSVQLGQFKTGVSRQFNAGDHKLQFADRTWASNYFSLGRQSGAKAGIEALDGVTLNAGIYNGISTGEGINSTGVDTKHTGVVDVRADLLGKQDAYSEGDVDWTDELALNVGAAYGYSEGNQSIGGVSTGVTDHVVSADANLKVSGISVNGEFFYARYDPDSSEASSPLGGYIQAGYFVDPKTTEVAARYSITGCDDGKANGLCAGQDQIQQVTVGLNYYWWKHNLKAQLNYDHLNQNPVGAGDTVNTNRWLIQLSSYF